MRALSEGAESRAADSREEGLDMAEVLPPVLPAQRGLPRGWTTVGLAASTAGLLGSLYLFSAYLGGLLNVYPWYSWLEGSTGRIYVALALALAGGAFGSALGWLGRRRAQHRGERDRLATATLWLSLTGPILVAGIIAVTLLSFAWSFSAAAQ